jgi:molecular chaperone DnaK
VSENDEKLDEADKTALNAAITSAKEDLEGGDPAQLDAARQRIEGELHKVAEKLYKSEAASAEGAGGPPPGNGAGGADDDVIDAEFTQENDDS